MTGKTAQEYITSIQQSIENIVNTCKELSEETIRWKPSEEEWSILQILSHVCEATPYWLNEMRRVLEQPGVEWGRGLQDADRLAAVANPDTLSVKETLVAVEALKSQVQESLQNLTVEQFSIKSPHRNFAKFGNKPVSFIIEHFIEKHVAGHAKQIHRNLTKLAAKERK
jgi:uncharacterized damage-inducible protein DinB